MNENFIKCVLIGSVIAALCAVVFLLIYEVVGANKPPELPLMEFSVGSDTVRVIELHDGTQCVKWAGEIECWGGVSV